MASRREMVASRAQGKRPAEPSQPEQTEARRKARHQDEVSYLEAFIVDSILIGEKDSRGVSDDDAYDILFFSKYGCYVMAWMQSHGNFSHLEVISYELLEGEVFNSKFCINSLEPISIAIERIGSSRWGCNYGDACFPNRCLPKAISFSIQLQIVHGLNRWILDFLSFEMRGLELDIPPPPQSEGIHFEATFSKPMMTKSSYIAGSSSQPSFTELPHTKIPSHAPDHAPWMDVSAQISSLRTRMEELALVSDT
ncbi:hypothetical protein CK203_083161 [Vitis vinifera]|uniref:Uncharacterized protein n=1 Tax=Vitis vinifera TaxID=29760 RepID=A0A438DWK9_VITVI|nr:hypothetical protein CK203_083161 [Vitis vinifera]